MPAVAFKQSLDCQPAALEPSIFAQGGDGIVGAGGAEATAVAEKGADGPLI
jgi:hypothetical protein